MPGTSLPPLLLLLLRLLSHLLFSRYDKKSECLKRSYTNSHKRLVSYGDQTVQLQVDGDFTFDENLCDIQALEMMSRRELANIEREDKIPGVNFTKEQTFFINIAQVGSRLPSHLITLII